jgi:preprotein translocase subunit SecG
MNLPDGMNLPQTINRAKMLLNLAYVMFAVLPFLAPRSVLPDISMSLPSMPTWEWPAWPASTSVQPITEDEELTLCVRMNLGLKKNLSKMQITVDNLANSSMFQCNTYLDGNRSEWQGYVDGNRSECKGYLDGKHSEWNTSLDGNRSEWKGYLDGNRSEWKGYLDGNSSEWKGYLDGNRSEWNRYLDKWISQRDHNFAALNEDLKKTKTLLQAQRKPLSCLLTIANWICNTATGAFVVIVTNIVTAIAHFWTNLAWFKQKHPNASFVATVFGMLNCSCFGAGIAVFSKNSFAFLQENMTWLVVLWCAISVLLAYIVVQGLQHRSDLKLRREVEEKRSMLSYMNNYYQFVVGVTTYAPADFEKTVFVMHQDKEKQDDVVFKSFQVLANAPRATGTQMAAKEKPNFQWTSEREHSAEIFVTWMREIQKMKQDRNYKKFLDSIFLFEFQRLGYNMHKHLYSAHNLIKVDGETSVESKSYDDVLAIFKGVYNEVDHAEKTIISHALEDDSAIQDKTRKPAFSQAEVRTIEVTAHPLSSKNRNHLFLRKRHG